MIKAQAKLIRQCITVHNEDNIIHHDDPTDFLVSITRAGTVHVPTTIHGEPVLANFVVLGVVSLLVIPVRSYFFAVAGCKLIQRIRVMCFEKVVHMEVGWFDEPEHSSSAIGAKLSANAASVRALVGDALGQLVETAASAVAGLVIAFVASWQLTLIALVLIPLIGVNGFLLMKFMEGFIEDAKLCINTSDSSVRHSSLLGIKLFQPTM